MARSAFLSGPGLVAAIALGHGLGTACATNAGATGTLALFANGETFATEGFRAPELTRDGWALRFEHIFVTLAGVTALQTAPPQGAGAGGLPTSAAHVTAAATVVLPIAAAEHLTLDLTATGADGRVPIAEVAAPAGHYDALIWSVVPAEKGDWAGNSVVMIGTATRGSETVAFTLTSSATLTHVCGEYVGETRKGFVTAGGTGDLELTFHLDHVFGRSDLGRADGPNRGAPGFEPFATGGLQAIDLTGLHIGHVGEGHCTVAYR